MQRAAGGSMRPLSLELLLLLLLILQVRTQPHLGCCLCKQLVSKGMTAAIRVVCPGTYTCAHAHVNNPEDHEQHHQWQNNNRIHFSVHT
jgi:hypothetical protein